MALTFPDLNARPPIKEALHILQEHTAGYGVFFDLDRVYEYESDEIVQFNRIDRELRNITGRDIPYTKRDAMYSLFTDYLDIPKEKCYNDKKDAYTTDKDIRTRLMADESLSEEVRMVIKAIHEARACAYRISYLNQYKQLPLCTAESYDNHRMVLAKPTWGLLNTGRISASKPSVQNIYRGYCDLTTSPKGYLLVCADSGQIEPRIMYSYYVRDELIKNLITIYDDAYKGIAVFCTLNVEEERKYRADFSAYQPVPIDDAFLAKRKVFKTLSNAGNYGSSNLDYIDPVLADAFSRKIVNHPLRLKLQADVESYVRRGGDTFTTAFGSTIKPEETAKYKKGSRAWINHVVRCGVNNPVQGTAADLMCFSVVEADKILSTVPDSWIGYYKHDEGAFYIPDTREDLIPQLTELTAYNVADWIPIKADAKIGVKKTERDMPRLIL